MQNDFSRDGFVGVVFDRIKERGWIQRWVWPDPEFEYERALIPFRNVQYVSRDVCETLVAVENEDCLGSVQGMRAVPDIIAAMRSSGHQMVQLISRHDAENPAQVAVSVDHIEKIIRLYSDDSPSGDQPQSLLVFTDGKRLLVEGTGADVAFKISESHRPRWGGSRFLPEQRAVQ